MVENVKKLCLSCSISEEPCIIWLSFMVHLCKLIISLAVFSFFQSFDLANWRHKRAKNGPKWQKIVAVSFVSQEPCMILFWFLVHMCKMMISPAIFFIFFKFRFFLVFSPLKTQNQNFEKMKKFAGDIIILYMCTKNQNDIMHGSWDTKWHSNKRAKNGMKLPISVCHTLYLRNSRSCHRDFVTQV